MEIKDIHTFYGSSHILFGIAFNLQEGELVCLLGRNGAGKTTTFSSIVGLCNISSGEIIFREENITNIPPYIRARRGIGLVPQGNPVFPELTVRENLEVARKTDPGGNREWDYENIYGLFPKLQHLTSKKAKYLSGGERQMLNIARALIGNPGLLLMDEPTEGLAPLVVKFLGEQIQELHSEGVTILLAEQNVAWALSIVRRCMIIEKGTICFQGTPHDLEQNHEVKVRTLGVA